MIGGIIMAGTVASGGAVVIALGAIGLVISAYKSIRKFFSDSYKQAEQRKSLAKALDTLQENITEQYCKNIANHIEEVRRHYQEQREAIEQESKKLEQSVAMLQAMRERITKLQAHIAQEAQLPQTPKEQQ